MRKKQILVLSLVASGIAIELILLVNYLTLAGQGNSKQALSTNPKSIASAVGENLGLDSGGPGEDVDQVYPVGAPITDEDHELAGEQDFSDGPPPLWETDPDAAMLDWDDAWSETPPAFDAGGAVLGDPGGGYSGYGGLNDAYPMPVFPSDDEAYDDDWWYDTAPTLPAGPTDVVPTDVPAASDTPAIPTGTAPPVNTAPTATQSISLNPQQPTATAQQPTTAAQRPTATAQQPTTAPQPTATVPPAGPTAPAPPPTATPTPEAPQEQAPQGQTLLSVRVDQAPALDGAGGDPAWSGAPAAVIATGGGANNSATQVSLQSVYDGEHVYFLLRWADPTYSFLRSPWEMREDGAWKWLRDPENRGRDDNLYDEDKLALFWPAGDQPDFAARGCGSACHAGENADAKPYGNMYTAGGEILDLWHWKSVRGVGQVDDLYLDGTRYSPDNPAAGFHPDPSDGGGYRDNANDSRDAPAYMPPGGGQKDGAPGFILESEKVEIDNSLFQPGERVPGIITEPFRGDRGQIDAAWRYADGYWTLEIRRKLVTGSPYDVQFDDLSNAYPFGLATFDNTQVRHAVQDGLWALRFQQ